MTMIEFQNPRTSSTSTCDTESKHTGFYLAAWCLIRPRRLLLKPILFHSCTVKLLEHEAACTKTNMCLDLAPQVDALAFRTRLEFSHCQHRK